VIRNNDDDDDNNNNNIASGLNFTSKFTSGYVDKVGNTVDGVLPISLVYSEYSIICNQQDIHI
jgi:hypothetical protein